MSESKIETISDVIDFLNNHVIECDEGTCGWCDDLRKSVKVLEQVLKNANTIKPI